MDLNNNFKTINEILVNTQVDADDEIEENEENINIDDYIQDPEEKDFVKLTDLLNIYNCYFKQLHQRKQEGTLFDDINYDNEYSTNKCLEFLYEELFKYNKSNEDDKDILYQPIDKEIDIEKWQEMYGLYIDNEQQYICKFMLPLLHYLTTLNWSKINWSIKPLKN